MSSWFFNNLVGAWLMPPGLILLLLLAGLWLQRRKPLWGRACLITAVATLYLLATPLVSKYLLQSWESPPASSATFAPAQAIVVLGGGQYRSAPEYGADTVAAATLVRLRYAAYLHRRNGLPVLVSGGHPGGGAASEARAMRETLQQEFGVPVRWVEERSANTLENARLSRDLLRAENIEHILLVTQAWHMPRSKLVFEQAGFQVIPAPTGHATRDRPLILELMPQAEAMADSAWFMHEVIGMLWYRLRLLAQV